ncbi:IS66 family insertion sequence element accessory protein TnpA [Desulfobacterota bacterium M19]
MANHNRQEQEINKQRFWKAHVGAWRKSGLSQNEYCRQNNLRSNQLGYWKNTLGRQTAAANFVPVPIPAQEQKTEAGGSASGITVYLETGMRIKVENDFTAETLAKVVAVLGGQL